MSLPFWKKLDSGGWRVAVAFGAMVTGTLLVDVVAANPAEALPNLEFVELLEVVSTSARLERENLVKESPEMAGILREARRSLSLASLDPDLTVDAVVGRLQEDLQSFPGREYARVLDRLWSLLGLYERFYELNETAIAAGERWRCAAFLLAMSEGLGKDAGRIALIAGDGGAANPIQWLRDQDLRH